MLEENKISSSQYQEALAFDIKKSLAPHTKKAYVTFPYLMMETERQAAAILLTLENNNQESAKGASQLEEARQLLLTGGYRVYTTIDKSIQRNAQHLRRQQQFYQREQKQGP